MKNLNIYELHEEINKKKNKRNQSFEHVLETCHRKIKTASTKELVKVFFDVPEFVIGLPVYDLSECIKYIMKSLEENGFLVRYYFKQQREPRPRLGQSKSLCCPSGLERPQCPDHVPIAAPPPGVPVTLVL